MITYGFPVTICKTVSIVCVIEVVTCHLLFLFNYRSEKGEKMAKTKRTPRKAELKAIREIKYQQKQTKPAIPKIALAR